MARATLGTVIKKGDVINKEYEVLRKLGEGGCGTVFLCRCLVPPVMRKFKGRTKPKGKVTTHALAAVKMLDRSGDAQRFLRERNVLKNANNDHVVEMIGSGYHDDIPYISLEYVEGGSLRDLMDKRKEMPVDEAAWILIQTIRGLRASNAVHRDLKPENILLTPGEGRTETPRLIINDTKRGAVVKVADFGLARESDLSKTRLTNTGQVMGTPVYMSPEQCRSTKKVDVKTDIYALGVLFYEMLAAKVPFEGATAYDTMKLHLEAEVKYPRIIGKQAKQIIRRCLEKTKSKRYSSLTALEKELCALAGKGVESGVGIGSSWGRVFVIAFIGVALLATLAWYLRDRLFGL